MFAGYTTVTVLLFNLLPFGSESLPAEVVNVNGVVTMEVPFGEDAIVTCRSNDDGYNFWYWNLLDKNVIIGARNKYDHSKFRFSILSGNLTVKAVSKEDEGVYACVSRGIVNDDVNIEKTRIVVHKEWQEVYENDPTVNVFRIIIIVATLAILSMGGYFLYRMWRDRYRYPRYLEEEDEDDDDSAEELFRAPGTSGTSGKSTLKSSGSIVIEKNRPDFDNPSISTDFKSILDTVNNK